MCVCAYGPKRSGSDGFFFSAALSNKIIAAIAAFMDLIFRANGWATKRE